LINSGKEPIIDENKYYLNSISMLAGESYIDTINGYKVTYESSAPEGAKIKIERITESGKDILKKTGLPKIGSIKPPIRGTQLPSSGPSPSQVESTTPAIETSTTTQTTSTQVS
ncbi:MAG: hypothetical protein AABY22_28235, partial [Nanoarchaeota archaeon]